MKSCLIVEGGGFRTGFTAGVLDTFLALNHKPFDSYVGVSGGTISLSYFLSGQYRDCISAIKFVAEDKEFAQLRRVFGEEGYMNIELIATSAGNGAKFSLEQALQNVKDLDVRFVATCKEEGTAEYLVPDEESWIDAIVASCTLPFVTKGKHQVKDRMYFDGGWSDALPVRWAYEQGAREILVIRTNPEEFRSTQSWADYFGSKYFDESTGLGAVFANSHTHYNESLEFIENPPSDLKIHQIVPEEALQSGLYTYGEKTILADYRTGLDMGLSYLKLGVD